MRKEHRNTNIQRPVDKEKTAIKMKRWKRKSGKYGVGISGE